MNIDIKESVFRYIYPASIFWTLMLIFNKNILLNFLHVTLKGFDGATSLIIFILFISSGFIINSISTLIISEIDTIKQSPWSTTKKEFLYWRKLGEDCIINEFVRNKIDRRWNFFTINVASLLAVFAVFLFTCFRSSFESHFAILLLGLLIILFYKLSKITYIRACDFNDVYEEYKLKSCQIKKSKV